jgi:hypothetical protein
MFTILTLNIILYYIFRFFEQYLQNRKCTSYNGWRLPYDDGDPRTNGEISPFYPCNIHHRHEDKDVTKTLILCIKDVTKTLILCIFLVCKATWWSYVANICRCRHIFAWVFSLAYIVSLCSDGLSCVIDHFRRAKCEGMFCTSVCSEQTYDLSPW